MLKRKLMDKLVAWKKEENKPALLIKGARQVGKTYLIEHFIKDNYDNYIFINFELMPEYKKIFDGNLDFDTIKIKLEVYFPDIKIEKGKTVLFLDEIQSCPNARVALKSLTSDGTLDVIASGSLPGLFYKEISSFPVGYERDIELFPLDFEEFLWALGVSESTTNMLRESFQEKKPVDEAILVKINEYFKQYLLIGGMPAVVNSYLDSKSLQRALETQNALVDNYKNDIVKYASRIEKQKIIHTFESIPMQLARKNKKFMFSAIDPSDSNSSERKYGSALDWLKDAGIAKYCYNLTEPALPLNQNRKLDSYKIYMFDTGLLISMMEQGIQKAIIDDNLDINEGGIAENICAEELSSHGYSLKYFERKSSLEVDFILDLDGVATAIEIKSGNNNQAKSLAMIISNYKTVKRYMKFERDANVYISEDNVEHYPLFMIAFV